MEKNKTHSSKIRIWYFFIGILLDKLIDGVLNLIGFITPTSLFIRVILLIIFVSLALLIENRFRMRN